MAEEKRSTDEIALAVLTHWRRDFPEVAMKARAVAELMQRISLAIANYSK